MRSRSLWWILLAGALVVLACDRDKDTAQGQTPPASAASAPADTTGPTLTFPLTAIRHLRSMASAPCNM